MVHLESSPTARSMLTSKQVPTMNVHMLMLEFCLQLLRILAILTKAVNNSCGITVRYQPEYSTLTKPILSVHVDVFMACVYQLL